LKYPAFLGRGIFFEEGMNPSRMIPIKEAAAKIKSFSLYNFPPFVKGGEGGVDGPAWGKSP
jgi:hypothetical protein